MDNQTFCSSFWNHQQISTTGEVKPCCRFNGAKVTATATPGAPKGKAPCLNYKYSGYFGKQGTSIEVKRGTPVFAVKDMKLLYATDYSSEFACWKDNKSQDKPDKQTKIKILKHPHYDKKIRCRY